MSTVTHPSPDPNCDQRERLSLRLVRGWPLEEAALMEGFSLADLEWLVGDEELQALVDKHADFAGMSKEESLEALTDLALQVVEDAIAEGDTDVALALIEDAALADCSSASADGTEIESSEDKSPVQLMPAPVALRSENDLGSPSNTPTKAIAINRSGAKAHHCHVIVSKPSNIHPASALVQTEAFRPAFGSPVPTHNSLKDKTMRPIPP